MKICDKALAKRTDKLDLKCPTEDSEDNHLLASNFIPQGLTKARLEALDIVEWMLVAADSNMELFKAKCLDYILQHSTEVSSCTCTCI